MARQEVAHAGFRIEPDRCGGLSRRSARTFQAAEKERRADADVGLETIAGVAYHQGRHFPDDHLLMDP